MARFASAARRTGSSVGYCGSVLRSSSSSNEKELSPRVIIRLRDCSSLATRSAALRLSPSIFGALPSGQRGVDPCLPLADRGHGFEEEPDERDDQTTSDCGHQDDFSFSLTLECRGRIGRRCVFLSLFHCYRIFRFSKEGGSILPKSNRGAGPKSSNP